MPSFPISAHGRTHAPKSHITSLFHRPVLQTIKKRSSNQQMAVLKPFYGGFPSLCQELLKSFPLPFLQFTHCFWDPKIGITLCQISGVLHTDVNHKTTPIASVTTLMWAPKQHMVCPVIPHSSSSTLGWMSHSSMHCLWLQAHGFNPQPIPGKQEGCQDHLYVLGHHTGKCIHEQWEPIKEQQQSATQRGKKGAKRAEPLSSGEI